MPVSPNRPPVLVRTALALSVVAFCTGCPPQIQSGEAVKFGEGVASSRQQALAAFTEINDLTSQTSIDRAVAQPTLKDSDLPVVLAPAQVQQWENALSSIEAYSAKLVALMSPDLPNGFQESVVALGNQLAATKPSAVPDPGIATALAKVGGLLIAHKAQHDARKMARAADADVRDVLLRLADVIGEGVGGLEADAAAGASPDTLPADETSRTLRGTVAENYRLQLSRLRVDFLRPGADKRRVVTEYLRVRNRRDAHDLALASLRQSLRSLADAHTALAAGSAPGLDATLGGVRRELKSTRDLFDRMKAVEDAAVMKEKEQEETKRRERGERRTSDATSRPADADANHN